MTREMQSRLVEAYLNLGLDYLRTPGRDRDAIVALTRGLAMNPPNPEVVYYTRAVAHEMIGDASAARADYQAAADARPDWQAPREQLQRLTARRR